MGGHGWWREEMERREKERKRKMGEEERGVVFKHSLLALSTNFPSIIKKYDR